MSSKKPTRSKAPSKTKKAKSKGKVPAPAEKPAELSDEELDDVSGGAGYLSGGYTSLSAGYTITQPTTQLDPTVSNWDLLWSTKK